MRADLDLTATESSSTFDIPDGATRRTLFESSEILVKAVIFAVDDLCYVTFDSYCDEPGLDRAGFGEHYFTSRRISAIHVISRDNRWYQYPELPQALALVADHVRGRSRVIAYGSSMGGFAALTYGSACGADVGLALSPQYSLRPRTPPHDRRWAADVARIRFQRFRPPPLPLQYIIYDPRDRLDRAHAELFAERSPTRLIGIPHAGHPVGSYVNETDMFEPLFAGIADGSLTPPAARALERELRARRRMSGQYFFNMAVRIWQRHLPWSIALATAAVSAREDSASYRSFLAFLFNKAGDHNEAARHHVAALAMPGANVHTMVNLVTHHMDSGDLNEAVRLADTLCAMYPGTRAVKVCATRARRRRWIKRFQALTMLWRPKAFNQPCGPAPRCDRTET